MTPPTVIYVITKATWGGAQKYVWDLATHATHEGFTPVLAYGEAGILSARLEKEGIRTLRIPALARDVSLLNDLRACRQLYALLKKEKPEVVHLNSSKAGFIGALAARLARVPRIIFTVHGWAFNEPIHRVSKAFYSFFHATTVRLSHLTIAVSDAVAGDAHGWVSHDRIKVIKNGIAPTHLLSKQEARAYIKSIDPSLSEDGLWVGTIAELNKNKGIDIGIKGWKKASIKGDWCIIGSGDEDRALKNQAYGTPSIHFLGFIPDASRYLRAFDLFLLPSRTEALAYVILEAGMAGIPVVASNVGGIPEAIGTSPVDTLFRSGDSRGLAQMLERYAKHPEQLTEAGHALKAHVTKHFPLDWMLESTFRTYR